MRVLQAVALDQREQRRGSDVCSLMQRPAGCRIQANLDQGEPRLCGLTLLRLPRLFPVADFMLRIARIE
jgi:hypothetical protein